MHFNYFLLTLLRLVAVNLGDLVFPIALYDKAEPLKVDPISNPPCRFYK